MAILVIVVVKAVLLDCLKVDDYYSFELPALQEQDSYIPHLLLEQAMVV